MDARVHVANGVDAGLSIGDIALAQRSKPRPTTALALAACVAAWCGTAYAQVGVSFSPSTVNIPLGGRARVAIVAGPTSLAAFQCELAFDPALIDVTNPNEAYRGTVLPFAPLGADPACTTVRGTPSCPDPPWVLTSTGRVPVGTDSIDNATGSVRFAYGTHGPGSLPAAGGTIALVEVVGVYNGTVTVTLADARLADAAEPPTSFPFSAGTLTVVVGSGIANLPPVLAPIGPRSVYEELTVVVPLSASDPDAGNVVSLAATGVPPFCTFASNGGSGSLTCHPLSGNAGDYPITVTAQDNGGPVLSDAETFTLSVLPTNCVDADGDGYGANGDPSCRLGTSVDCDDTRLAVNPAGVERCRNGLDDDCDGAIDAAESICPAPACLRIQLFAVGTDPKITFSPAATCPAPGTLLRAAHAVWGDLDAVRFVGGEVKLGPVSSITCASTADTRPFDSLKPDPGQVDFILVRETTRADYGVSRDGRPRTPDSGDCP